MSQYTPEHVEREIESLNLRNGTEAAQGMLRAYAATLHQQGWQCAVHEAMVERAVKAAYKHDTTERVHIDRETMAAALQAALGQHGQPNMQEMEAADILRVDADRLATAIQASQHGQQGEEQAVAFLNTKYQTLFHAPEIGNTERNAALLASGELVRLYTRPAARARVPHGWRETIREAIDCIADVELYKGNLTIGVYRNIGGKLQAMLAAVPSAESGEVEA